MDVSAISAALGMQKDLATTQSTSANETAFKDVLTNALNSGEDEALKKACDDIETYMLSMLFKQVKESMLSDDEDGLLPKGDYIKMFEGNMIQALAEETTKAGGVGFSKAIYDQMKISYASQMNVSKENESKSINEIDSEM